MPDTNGGQRFLPNCIWLHPYEPLRKAIDEAELAIHPPQDPTIRVYYSDASCISLPGYFRTGACRGAAAVVWLEDGVWQDRVTHFSFYHSGEHRGSDFMELNGVTRALAYACEHVQEEEREPGNRTRLIKIFTDNTSILDMFFYAPRPGQDHFTPVERDYLSEAFDSIQWLGEKRGVAVELRWVPAHRGVTGNERADTLAREVLWDHWVEVTTEATMPVASPYSELDY